MPHNITIQVPWLGLLVSTMKAWLAPSTPGSGWNLAFLVKVCCEVFQRTILLPRRVPSSTEVLESFWQLRQNLRYDHCLVDNLFEVRKLGHNVPETAYVRHDIDIVELEVVEVL